MNKKGVNYKGKRVKISKKDLKEIINKIRSKRSLKELADFLEISYHTLQYDWLIKGNTIPLSKFNQILKISNISLESIKDKISFLESNWGQDRKSVV